MRFVVAVAELAREAERAQRELEAGGVFPRRGVAVGGLIASLLREQRLIVHELGQQVLVALRGGECHTVGQVALGFVGATRRQVYRTERVVDVDFQRDETELAGRLERRQQRSDCVLLRAEPMLAQAHAGERRGSARGVATSPVHPRRFEQELERDDEIGHVEVTAREGVQRARDELGILGAFRNRARLVRECQRPLGVSRPRELGRKSVERAHARGGRGGLRERRFELW